MVKMRIHELHIEEAIHSLRSSVMGLSDHEAQKRLAEFGPNLIERVQEEHLALKLLKEFTHFFAIILWLAAGLAFFAEWSQPGQGMLTLGFAIVGVIVINGFFSFWQEYRAERAITALQKLLPQLVKVLREGNSSQIPAVQLVPGDIIFLSEGDDIPADCRLIEAFGVRVNNATITGESLPKARDTHESQEEDLIEAKNVVLAGTSMVAGDGKALVFAIGMRTELGKIARLTQTSSETPSPLQKEIAYVSRIVAILAVGLGALFFFIGRGVGLSFWGNFIFAIGIIVANVPEGLLPTVTLALAMASQRMAKRNVLVRHLPAVEALGSATMICTDKTGTLTENRMAAREVFSPSMNQPYHLNEVLQRKDLPPILYYASYRCQNLKKSGNGGPGQWLGDPTEIALVEMARKAIPELKDSPMVDEVPFSSDRKYMSTLYQEASGLVLYSKGALETLLPLCDRIQLKTPKPLEADTRYRLLKVEEKMAKRGLRVLAFAYRPVPSSYSREGLEEDLIFLGLVGLEDPPRKEVPQSIQKCREAGIKVIMITGDHPDTAEAIGREIGMISCKNPVVVNGVTLRKTSEMELQLLLNAPEIIFARVDADQKMRIVIALKKKKEVVAVTGDGVNDAPALKLADIGVAMGVKGTDVAREASDIILMDDNFSSVVAAIEEGRAVFSNIRSFMTYILTSNIPEIIPYLGFVLLKIPLALTIIQILAIDLGTDLFPALALGVEKPDPDVMKHPPRRRSERLLNRSLFFRAYLFLGLMEAATSLAAFFHVLYGGGWRFGEMLSYSNPLYLQATTAALSAVVVIQVANVFMCRSDHKSVFSFSLLSNPLILFGIAIEALIILLIDYTPWGNLIFGTAPISWDVWLLMVPLAVGMVMVEETRKWMYRRIRFP